MISFLRLAGFGLATVLIATTPSRAQSVTWGAANDAANGVLRAEDIPGTTVTPVTYTNLFGDGYNIAVTTSQLSGQAGHIGLGSFFGPSWYFEGPAGGFANVSFQFFQTSSPATPAAVTGVHFRLEDVDEGEWFKNFVYTDAGGAAHTVSLSSPIFTFSLGYADYHATPDAFDVGGTNEGGSQAGKWIDVNFSSLAIRSFSFQPGRKDSSSGSVEMTALGEIRRYIDAGGAGVAVANGDDLRGISSQSTATNQTLATLLDGAAVGSSTVAMAFNAATPGLFAAQNTTVHSDVLSLSGTAGEKFVLQMSYNPAGVVDETQLFLAWYNGSSFVNAVLGNVGASEVVNPVPKLGAYDPSTDFLLGNYGVDTYNNTVWAVIDHNSDFVVAPTPEPASTLLAICGGVALLCRRRRPGSSRR